MIQDVRRPETVEELRAEVVRRHGELSKRLQQIARFVLEEPQDIALETLAVIGARSGVQPSAIVRFAQTFGFEGAGQMQKLFRDELLNSRLKPSYSERVRKISKDDGPASGSGAGLLRQFAASHAIALDGLVQEFSSSELDAAIGMIDAATTVHVVAVRRTFPVASYLVYNLLQIGKRANLVDGVAGFAEQQISTLDSSDLLIAISFQPYAEETKRALAAAVRQKLKILAITDSAVSPIAKAASQALLVREADIHGFHSISASMCLAQVLAIGLASRGAGSDSASA